MLKPCLITNRANVLLFFNDKDGIDFPRKVHQLLVAVCDDHEADRNNDLIRLEVEITLLSSAIHTELQRVSCSDHNNMAKSRKVRR